MADRAENDLLRNVRDGYGLRAIAKSRGARVHACAPATAHNHTSGCSPLNNF